MAAASPVSHDGIIGNTGGRESVLRPSLPRDFSWALLGRHGQLEASVIIFTLLTLFSPALVGAFSLREFRQLGNKINSEATGDHLRGEFDDWLLSVLIGYAASLLGGTIRNVAFFISPSFGSGASSSIFGGPFHEFWAWGLNYRS